MHALPVNTYEGDTSGLPLDNFSPLTSHEERKARQNFDVYEKSNNASEEAVVRHIPADTTCIRNSKENVWK